jgi:hypothetical protein
MTERARDPHRPLASLGTTCLLPLAATMLLPQLAAAQAPTADVRNTCSVASVAMVNLMGGATVEQGLNGCTTTIEKTQRRLNLASRAPSR